MSDAPTRSVPPVDPGDSADPASAGAVGERAKAELQATEERKRRRVQFALIGALGLLLLGGGAVAWWQDKRHRDEHERLNRNGEAVAELIQRCEEALPANDAPAATFAIDQAEKLSAEGGADYLRGHLVRCRADQTMLLELDRIDDLRWEVVRGKIPGNERAAAEWPAAFARLGIVPGTTPLAEAVLRVNESFVRERLLTALDLWLAQSRSADILAILRAVDPDPFRDEVRAAVLIGSDDRLRELANQPAALEQPARFAAALGDLTIIPMDRRERLLMAALARRPGDFTLLMTLGGIYEIETSKTAHERERWYRVAVAVRPANVIARERLGVALLDKGDLDGARKLLPRLPASSANLAPPLRAKN